MDVGRSGWVRLLKLSSSQTCRLVMAQPGGELIDLTPSYEPLKLSTPHNMSALQRSIGSRVLPSALRPTITRTIAPQYRSYATGPSSSEASPKTSPEDAPAAKLTTDSTQIREAGAAAAIRHQPDYNVAVDYRTSCVIE